MILLCAAAFSMIPVFPTYGIAFTSVPLIIWAIRRLYFMTSPEGGAVSEKKPVKLLLLYLIVFLYPLISYFSYHGFFILCYIAAAVIILWVKDRRFPWSTFLSAAVLSVGYMVFEYRLFREMLFGDTVTIRTTMEHGELSLPKALSVAAEEFIRASFHSEDSHTYLILPVVLIAFVVINLGYLMHRNITPVLSLSERLPVENGEKTPVSSQTAAYRILHEPLNGILLLIVFNCLIFGLYQHAPFRRIVETLVPKLTGFEFARFAYFNTLLWYAALAVVCVKLADSGKKLLQSLSLIIPAAALIIVMFAPAMYNDFYYTCYNQAYKLLKHRETSTVNYREFYSSELFEEIKADMGYSGEWSASYGLHPAVLEYNGIATVDGYLGMYPQSYKDTWEKIIEPAFACSPSLEAYFRDWGARVNLISPADENTYAPLRVFTLTDERLVADMDALRALDCVYIFSRIRFSNAGEAGITLVGEYTSPSSPYVIYVYRI